MYATFIEHRQGEVLGIPLPRTPVDNEGVGSPVQNTVTSEVRFHALLFSSAYSGLLDLTSSITWSSLATYCGGVALLPLSKLMLIFSHAPVCVGTRTKKRPRG
jgi:hypothetical protein